MTWASDKSGEPEDSEASNRTDEPNSTEEPGRAGGRLDPDTVNFGPGGLIPAVVQDTGDGRVLMVAWQDREALETTLASGEVHFHSRSRGTLWHKGASTGNVLRLVSAELDCDSDAILLTAYPTGPACHTGTRSCFDVGGAGGETAPTTGREFEGFGWLENLWSTVRERATTRPKGSYTARLLAGGVNQVSRKVAEEAVEVVMAAKDHAAAGDLVGPGAPESIALTGELADLIYHTLVLMAERQIAPAAVVRTLRERSTHPGRRAPQGLGADTGRRVSRMSGDRGA